MDCHGRPVPTGIVQASGLAACTNANASLSTINVGDTLVYMRRTDMLFGPAFLFLDFNFANALLQGGPYEDTQPVFEFFVMDLCIRVGRDYPGGYVTRVDYHKMEQGGVVEGGLWYVKHIKSRRLGVALVGEGEHRSQLYGFKDSGLHRSYEHRWSWVLRSRSSELIVRLLSALGLRARPTNPAEIIQSRWSRVFRFRSSELTARLLSALGLRARPTNFAEIIQRCSGFMQKFYYRIAQLHAIQLNEGTADTSAGQAGFSMERGDLVKFKHGNTRRGVMIKVVEDAVKVLEWRKGTQTFGEAYWISRSAVRQVYKTTDAEKDNLAQDLGYTCTMCGTSGFRERLSHCARCAAALYCGRHCQQEDWPRHKRECQARERLGGIDSLI